MKKLQTYLPFHFLFFLIIGICVQFYFQIWQFGLQKLFSVCILLIIFLFISDKFIKKRLFTICSWILFFVIGISSVFIRNPKNFNSYFAYHLTKNSNVALRITKKLKHNNFYNRYKAEVTQINNTKTIGKTILNIKKDSLQKQLSIGNVLLTTSNFKETLPPQNPHEFNYKSYLTKQKIYHQIFIEKNKYQIIDAEKFSTIGLSEKIRNKIQQTLKQYNFSNNEYAIINALLLGERNEISKELRENYTNAGAIHILAISGLHIGIIFTLLSYLFKPLHYIKNGKPITSFLIVILLWLFAIIAGLSASVVRAVTMFTFVTIGQSLQRKQPVEHSLITSMFVLLLIKPMFLFDIGFQLSYLAVFGIVWIQPLFAQLWKPKLKILYKAWQITTVSVSVQIAVLPISLYYFHQFPSLFLLSNIVIIPILGGILSGGIFIIFLSVLNILPPFLVDFYGWIISTLNNFISWISSQEQFLLKEISISFLLMLTWYALIILFFQFIIQRKPKQTVYLLSSVLLIQLVLIFEKYQQTHKKEFIVFHKNKQTIIGSRNGNQTKIYHNLDTLISKQPFLRNYKIRENTTLNINNKTPNIFQFKNNTILVVDSLGVYNIPQLKNVIVLLSQSPKINLNRLIYTLSPKQIIADGSNYKSYVQDWKQTCKKEKTPFHYTYENGAYILSN